MALFSPRPGPEDPCHLRFLVLDDKEAEQLRLMFPRRVATKSGQWEASTSKFHLIIRRREVQRGAVRTERKPHKVNDGFNALD